MEAVRRAVIDVGTNSIKLLVADVSGRDVRPVHEESRQTRLGKGFYATHRLQPESVAHTAAVVWEFVQVAREKNAQAVRIVATSAARDAENPGDLTTAIERAADLKVEIISGEQEAEWVFRGVTSDPELTKQPLLLMDVGGGSTEFIVGHGTHKQFARSFPLGTVRLLEKFPHSDPPTHREFVACRDWVRDLLRDQVRAEMEPMIRREAELQGGKMRLVGTGGTTSILARMEKKLDRFDRDRIESTLLSRDRILFHRKQLWSLPLAKRKEIVGLPRQRADVILTGVVIYEAVMEEFDFHELCVSTRGLRFAALMD